MRSLAWDEGGIGSFDGLVVLLDLTMREEALVLSAWLGRREALGCSMVRCCFVGLSDCFVVKC